MCRRMQRFGSRHSFALQEMIWSVPFVSEIVLSIYCQSTRDHDPLMVLVDAKLVPIRSAHFAMPFSLSSRTSCLMKPLNFSEYQSIHSHPYLPPLLEQTGPRSSHTQAP